MQITAVAALLSLAATGLAAPTAPSAGEGGAALGLRASDIAAPSEAAAAPEVVDFDLEDGDVDGDEEEEDDNDSEDLLSGTTPAVEKRKFNGGWCGIHMKIVEGDYHQADVTVKDASGNTIRSRHKKVARNKNLHFKFNKGLPGKDALQVDIGGVVGSIARVQYKDQDFNTGFANTQNANCKVGKWDIPWVYKDRSVVNLDCGFSC
ncbi:hypothetical protein PG985_003471 [Apiospora marii]|uniref:Uncharacterized protein n=1 Tax=Apiospora marii TaxID=335849 RepID=A0ABR1SJA2_9PEZI